MQLYGELVEALTGSPGPKRHSVDTAQDLEEQLQVFAFDSCLDSR